MSDQHKKIAAALVGLLLLGGLAFLFFNQTRNPPADPEATAAQQERARIESLIEQDRALAEAAAMANQAAREAELNAMDNILANTAEPAPELPLDIDLPLPTQNAPPPEEPATQPKALPPIPTGGDSNVFSSDIYLKRPAPKTDAR
jgi:hypothetical protein